MAKNKKHESNNANKLMNRLLAVQKSKYVSPASYSKNTRFLNRELSWLEFDERVLMEAKDRKNPLMERLSFLSITANNLDEFVMVRVASLKDMFHADYAKNDVAGLTTREQLAAISEQMHALVRDMYSSYDKMIVPALARVGIRILKPVQLTGPQLKELRDFFFRIVYPVLTPMAVDSGRPFPLINNKSLNICALLKKNTESVEKFATIQVPGVIPRLYCLKTVEDKNNDLMFVTLEDIVKLFISEIFPGTDIVAKAVYRIMRNADLEIDEEEASDLLLEIEKQIRKRRWGEVIRLETESDIDERLLIRLLPSLNVEEEDVYLIDGPLDLTFLSKLRSVKAIKKHKEWYYPSYEPQYPYFLSERKRSLENKKKPSDDIFSLIREGSILMHHPYESFEPVLEFIKQAATDPQVLAIKQTLYRISGDSPVVSYLEEAAKNGKQVLVLVELKARFDEENNIHWARRLEKAGCHVIYGLVGLKTHSKITLVLRKENEGIRRYLHLATGNYNDQTAKLYTDLGYFITQAELGSDATEFFNMLSGFSEPDFWNSLVVAPLWLRSSFEALIRREIMLAQKGVGGSMKVKMNSLVDHQMIELLYEASQAGVKIDLVVRGICCLRPGVEGLSENITVRSLVGRYLEHSRIYVFNNGGSKEIYLSSADWMTRNLSRRAELMFPIVEDDCRQAVEEIIDMQLKDNLRAHIMQSDGSYSKPDRRGVLSLDAQSRAAELAVERAIKINNVMETRRFEPARSPVED